MLSESCLFRFHRLLTPVTTCVDPPKVLIKVFDKLTGGKRKKDRVYQDGDEMVELQLRPGDAYEMDGVRTMYYFPFFQIVLLDLIGSNEK